VPHHRLARGDRGDDPAGHLLGGGLVSLDPGEHVGVDPAGVRADHLDAAPADLRSQGLGERVRRTSSGVRVAIDMLASVLW